MKLKNPFTKETRELFYDVRYKCFICGSNQMVEAHHIAGRISASPLNLAPLCKECHEKICHTFAEEQMLFTFTLRYLTSVGYSITQEDLDFIMSYPRLHAVIFSEAKGI